MQLQLFGSSVRYSNIMSTDDTKGFKYLTELDGHEHFKLIFTILGTACCELNYQSKELSPENELFLTLVKLRQAKDDYGLSLEFGMSRSVVAKVTRTWINLMYFELSELDFWPCRDVVDVPGYFSADVPINPSHIGCDRSADTKAKTL